MKQEELQRKARRELSALNIIGIPDVSAVRKAKEKLEAQETQGQPRRLPRAEETPVESTVVESTTESDIPEGKVDIRSNYHKFDNDISDVLARHQTPTEQAIYHRLYRLSYGYKRNTCRVGMGALAKACNIGSSSKTVKRAIDGLLGKGHIAVVEDHQNNKKGAVYRVFLPREIPGIESRTVVKSTTVESTTVDPTTVKSTTVGSTVVENTTATVVESTVVENTTVGSKPTDQGSGATVVESTVVDFTTNKDIIFKDIKNTLSPRAIITGFYKRTGHARITKHKRERAEKNFKELLKEGFSPEDIEFAVEWTLENAKEELYDFSIIKHTIGQAMAAKGEDEEREARKREKERMAAERQAEEHRREEEKARIEIYKGALSAEERAELRNRAEAEIRNSGQFKEEFITDYLIEAKENELIREQTKAKLFE
jgi:hypothetical protein